MPRHFDGQSSAREALLDAALAQVAEHGLASLTLRQLASRAGVSTPTIAHHLGAKDQIVVQLIEAARSKDAAFFSSWLERAAACPPSDRARRAWLAQHVMSAWTDTRREPAILFSELIRTGVAGQAHLDAFNAWVRDIREFWASFCESDALGYIMTAYVVDEAAFSLALPLAPSYVMLRDLCVSEAVQGLALRADARQSMSLLFDQLRSDLAPANSIVESTLEAQPKRDQIAEHAARLIIEHGADSLTHRLVASAAGVPASSVVYHFGSRQSLMLAGLEATLKHFRTWLSDYRAAARDRASPDSGSLEATRGLVRATHAVAMGAIWFPELQPHAIDMRRRRGENGRADAFPGLHPHLLANLDPVAAQILSVCLFGARLLAIATGEEEGEAIANLWRALNGDAEAQLTPRASAAPRRGRSQKFEQS